MTKIRQALIWGLAIVAMALAARFGLVERDSAATMLIVLPALAWIAISGRSDCRVRRTSPQ